MTERYEGDDFDRTHCATEMGPHYASQKIEQANQRAFDRQYMARLVEDSRQVVGDEPLLQAALIVATAVQHVELEVNL